jgi:serine/threonine protein kinase
LIVAVADPQQILIHGRYRQVQRIASGGLGHIYLGWDEQLERRVAIKRLRRDVADVAENDESAWKEAKTLGALQHPNIVTLFDYGNDEHGAFYVMEFIEGETLDARLQNGVFDADTFVDIARQALEGINAAHQLGILHRDLKPSNFMVRTLPNGGLNLKILDFGLAKFQQTPSPQTMDASNSIMGSVHYAAPEQFQGLPLDARTDLYSLGHVFYTCLVGSPAFQAASLYEVLNLHLYGQAGSLAELRPDLDPWIADWIHQLIQKDPNQRPNNSQEALETLYGWMRRQTSTFELQSQPIAAGASATSAPSKMGLYAGIGVAALVVLGGLGYFLTRGPSAETVVEPAVAQTAPVAPAPIQPATPPPVPAPVPAVAAPASSQNFPPSSKDIVPPTPPSLADGTWRPDDLTGLRSQLGQTVTVQGTPVDLGQNRAGNIRYLNFADDYRRAVSLVFFIEDKPEDFTELKLSQFLHRPIKVVGRVDEHRGNIQIKVTSLDQLSLVE